jgi:hypothetical protein
MGYNTRRINLLSGLMSALKLLTPLGCDTVHIGGSFITNKEKPNDIDGCFDGMSINLALIDPIFTEPDEQKARFGCELRIDSMSQFQGFLQKNSNGQSIGIIALNITSVI